MATQKKKKKKNIRHPLNIPDDLLFEILSQLPVKSLLVCKSVCKSWLLLIDNRQFVEAHFLFSCAKAKEESTQRALYRTGNSIASHFVESQFLFPATSVYNGRPISFPRPPPLSSMIINLQIPNPFCLYESGYRSTCLQPCRGGLVSITDPFVKGNLPGLILNPATGEFYQLPQLPNDQLLGEEADVGRKTTFCQNVVYDSSSGSYKVFRIILTDPSLMNCWTTAYVITLGKDAASWKKVFIVGSIPNNIIIDGDAADHDAAASISYYNYCVFSSLHGLPCWLFRGGEREALVRVFVFDAENENFFTIDIPKHRALIPRDHRYRSLAAFQGSLYLFDHYNRKDVLDVWVMKDYNEKKIWVKEKSCCDMKSFVSSRSTTIHAYATYDVRAQTVTDDGIVLRFRSEYRTWEDPMVYAIYYPIKRVLKRFDVSYELKALGDVKWTEFVESLVSPKRGY